MLPLAPPVPQEIKDEILGHLWNDRNALKACSLASKAFFETCQEHLFSSVEIYSPCPGGEENGTAARLQDLLKSSPHLSRYVKSLQIIDMGQGEWLSDDTTLAFSLPLLRNLRELTIEYELEPPNDDYAQKWKSIAQNGLLAALIDTLRLPSLTFLDISGVPLALLTHCSNLKRLHFGTPIVPLVELDFAVYRDSKIHVESLEITINGQPRNPYHTLHPIFQGFVRNKVDTASLKQFSAAADADIENHHDIWLVMKHFAGTLQELQFKPCFDVCLWESPFSDPIDWGCFAELRKFAVRLHAIHKYNSVIEADPFSWLTSTLKKLGGINSLLEELVMEIDYEVDDPADVVLWQTQWSTLTRMLADRKLFPRLRTVEIKIDFPSKGKPERQMVIDLMEMYFGVLREISAIDFKLAGS